jgi:hypothetical protein
MSGGRSCGSGSRRRCSTNGEIFMGLWYFGLVGSFEMLRINF